jgi:hypothetical protein
MGQLLYALPPSLKAVAMTKLGPSVLGVVWGSDALPRWAAPALLLLAALSLVVALHSMRAVLAPIGRLIQAVAATAVTVVALIAALFLLTAAAVGGH